MKFKELQKKSPADLQKDLDSAQFELMRYNAQVATGGAGKDTGKIRQFKKTIARIKTLQSKEARKNQ
jgi:large subunit ribosomal protein L29